MRLFLTFIFASFAVSGLAATSPDPTVENATMVITQGEEPPKLVHKCGSEQPQPAVIALASERLEIGLTLVCRP